MLDGFNNVKFEVKDNNHTVDCNTKEEIIFLKKEIDFLFKEGGSDEIIEVFSFFLNDSFDGGNSDDMWKGYVLSLIFPVILALVEMRDRKEILLDVDTIREYLILENIQKLASRRDLPNHIIQSLKSYLISLPGYVEGQPKQAEITMDNHGYCQMILMRPCYFFEEVFKNKNKNIVITKS